MLVLPFAIMMLDKHPQCLTVWSLFVVGIQTAGGFGNASKVLRLLELTILVICGNVLTTAENLSRVVKKHNKQTKKLCI